MSTNSSLDAAALVRPLRLRTNLLWSLYGVWYRHVRVYCKTLLANATPPVLEPLFFFVAIAYGLGGFVPTSGFDGLPYRSYVAAGMVVSSAMFTGVFETMYGTFVRLVYQKTYAAMLGTHLRIHEMFVGELLFAASKGAVFATVVLLVTMLLGAQPTAWCVLVPLVGFATAYLFACLGLIITSYVKMINNFSFFATGVITPLFYFSGTFFPIRGRSALLDVISVLVPLTAPIELSRALFKAQFTWETLMHLGILFAYGIVLHIFALRRMTARVLR
jgi:lipooligosaccharide transport system permease protein